MSKVVPSVKPYFPKEDKIAEKARILRDQGKENFNSNIIIELG